MARVVVVAPHVRPVAAVAPVKGNPAGALRILAGVKGKKMAEGGLDDDAPPLYSAYMASEHHMNKGGQAYAKGGEVEDGYEAIEPNDEDFLEPGARLDDELLGSPSDLNDEGSSDDMEDETGEGDHRAIVRSIFAALRARHAGRK